MNPLPFLLVCCAGWMNRHQQVVIEYLPEENHQGLDNKIIRPEFSPWPSTGPIRCRKRLGGMLNYYYREAA